MAATNGGPKTTYKAVIGNAEHFWLYSSEQGFDLTRPPNPESPAISPRITVETTTSPITIDPAKSALIIIDMQNYFLSEALGRAKGAGHQAADRLVDLIPNCRKAGIRIVWVNWGLTENEVDNMPPAVKRAFGFEAFPEGGGVGFAVDKHGMAGRIHKGLGSDMGKLRDHVTGEEFEGGRALMRGSWNAGLYPSLQSIYEESVDVWLHKNRMSGMWGSGSDLEVFLEKEGIKTLFFTGVNTDQCVGGTYQDSFSKGYDCILLGDCAATTSPAHAQQCMEFNAANTWGFLSSCEQLANAVEKAQL